MKNKYLLPILLTSTLVIGLVVGELIANRANRYNGQPLPLSVQPNKINELIQYMEQAYVDSLDVDSITEEVMIDLINRLDPHSSYIPAKDIEIVNSELEGSFSGIGVQFNIQNDTINIVGVISGGPSERVGVLAGDRIITVDDSLFVGKTINNEKVMHRLRGKKGSQVKLGIKRNSATELLTYIITRDDIPVHAVDASYMATNTIGLVRVSKFSENTYAEFLNALADLRNQGANKFIIDLRENTGGYMDQAINMANEFLSAGQLIVYSEGRAYPRFEAKANENGNFLHTPIVVLIDEFSASASEIFAGAMQDNDRATIIGRRSFGKGLVQQQLPFTDGSAMRFTVARYYTPSGRCIQKPYEMGKSLDYEMDIINRYEHGEFDNKDSIQINDTTVYYTIGGRIVHGGGGIMPDVFIPRDTSAYTPYLNRVINLAYTYQFAYRYTDIHRAELNKISTWQAMEKYLDKQNLLEQFVTFAQQKGVEPKPREIAISKSLLLRQLKAYIVRNILNDKGFYPLYLRDDKIVQQAIKTLETTE